MVATLWIGSLDLAIRHGIFKGTRVEEYKRREITGVEEREWKEKRGGKRVGKRVTAYITFS